MNPKQLVKTVLGWFLYHLKKHKDIILITSSERAGSTLLKSLITSKNDIVDIPEYPFNNMIGRTLYEKYFDIYRLSPKRKILLKHPGALNIPFPSHFIQQKIVILYRDVFPVAYSIVKMSKQPGTIFKSPVNYPYAVEKWYKVYSSLVSNTEISQHDSIEVFYEDLVRDPIQTTHKIFNFLKLENIVGIDQYEHPSGYKWEWGKDDGGEKIKSLRVTSTAVSLIDYPDELIQEGSKNEISDLRKKIGFEKLSDDLVCY